MEKRPGLVEVIPRKFPRLTSTIAVGDPPRALNVYSTFRVGCEPGICAASRAATDRKESRHAEDISQKDKADFISIVPLCECLRY
jgi:hypothetical protein